MTRASDLARLMGAGGTLNAALSVDTISEKTSGSGVTIDSLNVKDGGIGGHQIGGRRNLIINGAMQVAQRATSVTGVGGAAGYFTLDRYKLITSTTAGRATMSQTADGPSGFANCLKFDCTTADTSIAAGEYFILSTRLEGQDLQQLKKGTSEAEAVTVSFYVKGNANATYALELYDAVGGRHASQLFNVTTSWNRISLTFNGDTTDTLADSNALALEVNFWLHAGSNYTSGTLSADFASADNTRRAAGISSFFDSTDRTFFITGLQLEVGSQATPFEHRSFGEELALCYRYYQRYSGSTSFARYAIASNLSTTSAEAYLNTVVSMRASPSLETTGTASNYSLYDSDNVIALTSIAIEGGGNYSNNIIVIDAVVSSGLTDGGSSQLLNSNSTTGFLALSSEL
jgi:hypothetical protein